MMGIIKFKDLRRSQSGNLVRRRMLAPRLEWLESRRVLATLTAIGPDTASASAGIQVENESGTSVIGNAYSDKTVPNLNSVGTQSLTATAAIGNEYVSQSVTFGRTTSTSITFSGSATGQNNSSLFSEEGTGDASLDLTIVPDNPSIIQTVFVTVTGSYQIQYDDDSGVLTEGPYGFDCDDVGDGELSIDANPPILGQTPPPTNPQTFQMTSYSTSATGLYSPGSIEFTAPEFDTDELNVTFNLGITITTVPQLTVSAVNNQDSTTQPVTFGPYLAGVALPNAFTISIDPNLPDVGRVQYQFAPLPALSSQFGGYASQVSGTDNWSFSQDMGQLITTEVNPFGGPPSTVVANVLEVTVYSTGGEILQYSVFNVNIEQSLNFDLQANNPGNGADTKNIRYISGVSVPTTFNETISDVPSYYTNSFTGVNYEVRLGNGSVPSVNPYSNVLDYDITSVANDDGNLSFSFQADPGSLYVPAQSGVESTLLTSPIYPIFKTPSGGNGVLTRFGSAIVQLINLPSWMGPSALQSTSWTGSQYQINLSYVLAQSQIYTTANTPFGLFNNLQSYYSAGINLPITANLTYNPGDAQFGTVQAYATATVLGQQILNKTYNDGGLIALVGTLDPEFLIPTAPTIPGVSVPSSASIEIQATNIPLLPIEPSLFTRSFGANLPFTIPSPTPGVFSGDVSLQGQFQAGIQYLYGSLDVTLNYNSGTGVLAFGNNSDNSQSYVQLNAGAVATLQGSVNVTVGLFGLLNLGGIGASGAIGASAVAQLRVDLSGSLGSGLLLDPTFDKTNSFAGVAVATNFQLYRIEPDQPPPAPVTLTNNDIGEDWHTGLFGLSEPPVYSFNLLGPGNTNNAAIPGVPKNVISTLISLGPDPVGAPAPTLLNAQGNTPTTVLTGNDFVFGPITDVSFDLDVLADHPALTAGHHYLETMLLGSDGSQVILGDQDLASLPLQSNSNPLGYASGWTTLSYDVDNSQLEPGVAYQPVLLFTNDLAGTGQSVEAVIDNVSIQQPAPALSVSSPGVTPGNPVDLTSGSGIITLTNTGNATLLVDGLTLTGSGATLPASQQTEFAILPGDSVNVVVDRASPSTPVSADLGFETNDPNNASVTIALTAATAETTAFTSVSGSGTYGAAASLSATLTSSGSPLAGQLVVFSLQIGNSTTNLGTATTNSSGVATIPSVSLAGINAGTYQNAIQVSFAGATGYATTSGGGTLTVGHATLTVTAIDQDISHGGTVPSLTDTITGFIPGDGLLNVTGAAVLTTTVSSTSPAGIYPISVNVSGLTATNYSFIAVPGNVTVHPTVTNILVQWGSRSMSIVGLNRDLPFTNITAIDVVFSDNVNVSQSDLALAGTNVKNYSFSRFSYSSASDEATWTLPTAIGIDHLLLTLDGTSPIGVHSAVGSIPLLANTTQSFAVLPGDFNGDGIVNSQDLVDIRDQILGITPATIWGDIDGIGTVTLQDYLDAQKRLGTHF